MSNWSWVNGWPDTLKYFDRLVIVILPFVLLNVIKNMFIWNLFNFNTSDPCDDTSQSYQRFDLGIFILVLLLAWLTLSLLCFSLPMWVVSLIFQACFYNKMTVCELVVSESGPCLCSYPWKTLGNCSNSHQSTSLLIYWGFRTRL